VKLESAASTNGSRRDRVYEGQYISIEGECYLKTYCTTVMSKYECKGNTFIKQRIKAVNLKNYIYYIIIFVFLHFGPCVFP
jgi:hypothetical protein